MPAKAILSFLASVLLAGVVSAQTPMGTAFTYQGHLSDGVAPANGTYDLRFTLYDAPALGGVVAGPLTVGPVTVSQGLFTVTLDFGAAAFAGQARWLRIEVQPSGGGGFTALTPRQALTPSPHTVFSSRTDPLNLTSLNANNLTSGTVPSNRLVGTYAQALNLNNAANTITGTFTGSGFSLTSLNASNLASGTVPDAQFSGAYTNALTLSNPANAFVGDGSGLTNLNAQARYARTVVVSPVGTSAQNGTALLLALAGITTASATNPWLLKIEPGIYALGTASFVMKPYVDVEGSGETVTRITGLGNASNLVGTVQAVTNSELRFLTVENTGGAAYAKPLLISGASPRITHVTVLGAGGTTESQGLYAMNAASPTVTDVTVSVSASGSAWNYAVANIQGSTSVFFNLKVNATGGAYCRAVSSYDSTPTLRNVVAVASGGSTENQGVANFNSSPTMENVTAVATGPAVNNLGVLNFGAVSAPSMCHVTCRGSGATDINWGCVTASGAQPTMVDVEAEAVGGTTARAFGNVPAGPGLTMIRVRAVASGGSSENTGLYNDNSSPRIVDLAVVVNGSGAASAQGIQILSSSPSLSSVVINAGGSTSGVVAGIYVSGATSAPTIAAAVVTASGSSTNTYGVWTNGSGLLTLTKGNFSVLGGNGLSAAFLNSSPLSLTEVSATVSAPAGIVIGIKNLSATAQLASVNFTVTGVSSYALSNDTGTSTVSVDRSTLNGGFRSVLNTGGSSLRVGGSQLVGPVATVAGSVTSCVLSYNGAYAAVNAVCQ